MPTIAAVRLASGLVLATFVTLHFTNHALGIVSVEAQESARRVLSPIWRSVPGTLLLYAALVAHASLGLYALWRRQTLRMPAWEMTQLAFGVSIPLLLVPHVFGARVAPTMLGSDSSYATVVAGLWSSAETMVRQPVLLVVVWTHLMIGLHYWLRLRARYRRMLPVLRIVAVMVPVLALLGFVAAGVELAERPRAKPAAVADAYGYGSSGESADDYGSAAAAPSAAERARFETTKDAVFWGYAALLGLVLAARVARRQLSVRRGVYRIRHASGRTVIAPIGQSVLEALREAAIPHASVCGGRARCTTCRVRVVTMQRALPEPAALETQALARIHAEPDVRLACQLRPGGDVRVTPLLPPHVGALHADAVAHPGRERAVAVMFVDLRESSRLGEQRLPYDVFFILNRFFAEMAEALRETRGYYSTFNGDGFMALYGTTSDLERGCRDAMRGAIAVLDRLDRINSALAADLREPLRVGVSIHAGDAIVGSMGPPDHPVLSALGDTVNVAARLEAETKRHGCMLVVSAACADAAGVDLSAFERHTASVRGRGQPATYYTIDDPQRLALLVVAERETATPR